MQEQRNRFRRGQHGQLRGKGPGDVAAQLQGILFAPAIGVAVALALGEYLTEPAQIFGNVLQYVAFPYQVQQTGVDPVLLQFARFIAPGPDDVPHFLSLFHRRADSLGNAGGQIVLIFSGFGVDHLAYGLHLTLLTVRPVGGLHHGLLQLWVALLTPLHPLQQAGQVPLGLFLTLFQLLQGVQGVILAAQV